MDFDQPPVVRVSVRPEHRPAPDQWPSTISAVAQLVRDGMDLAKGVTFLVGENGSGKSTIVEAIAVAYGLSPEGGSPMGKHSTRESESPLSKSLTVQRGIGTGRWGFFLRAETMHGWYTYSEQHQGPNFHDMSHGESFLALLEARFDSAGFYVLDEPEAALSFSSTLSLIAILQRVVADGGQVLCATHSPVLAAMPGAHILEVGEWGLRECHWDDLQMVDHWRRFLQRPESYLRHLNVD